MELQYQINLPHTGLADDQQRQIQHGRLLKKLVENGEPTLVPPQSGSGDADDAANPTDFLLVIAPVSNEAGVMGLVEIFQRPGGGPTTQRGYLRFLVQMCNLATDFLKNRRLRLFRYHESLWEQLEQFICAVHRSLDLKQTAYTIANEGRRIVEADRVSVAVTRGRSCRVEAVSGLDALDRRAEEVRRMSRLAQTVLAANEPLWYPDEDNDLPPQIESALQDYLDQSNATMVAVLPLAADARQTAHPTANPLGALIIEQLNRGRPSDHLRRRSEAIAGYAANALRNATEHQSVFLMPVWKALGKTSWIVKARNLPKTLGVAALLLLAIGFLAAWPARFDLAAEGKLLPSQRRDIFARIDGIVVDIPVRHGQHVEQDAILAVLKNTDLESEIAGIINQLATVNQQIKSIQRTLLNNPRLSPVEQNQLDGEFLELKQEESHLETQLQLYRQKEEQLTVRSDMAGEVVTWKVEESLMRRPVQTGQVLMRLANPEGDWELELYMPLRRMGHVAEARRELEAAQSDDNLQVTFVLTSHPGMEFTGQVTHIDRVAQVRDEHGNSVLLRVAIDKHDLPELRNGTTVMAKVNCGERPIGYVWFHDLWETIETRVLFWL